MGEKTTYEVYTFKAGNWTVDSIYDDKRQALHEARLLVGSHFTMGVKVIQETYNDATNETKAVVIFNEIKGREKTTPAGKPETKGDRIRTASARKPPPKNGELTKRLITLVLVVGGILLASILALLFLVSRFG